MLCVIKYIDLNFTRLHISNESISDMVELAVFLIHLCLHLTKVFICFNT